MFLDEGALSGSTHPPNPCVGPAPLPSQSCRSGGVERNHGKKGGKWMSVHIGKRYVFSLGDEDCIQVYIAEVELTTDALTGPGWVVDFGELAPLGRYLSSEAGRADLHQYQREDSVPDAIAAHVTSWFTANLAPGIAARLVAIRVWESDETWAERSTRFTFAAGHHLPSLPHSHKCSRPHGHTYTAQVVIPDQHLSDPQVAAALGRFGEFLRQRFDHRVLNDVLDAEPTCEALAGVFAQWFADQAVRDSITAVRVWESPSAWAEAPVSAVGS